MFKRPSVHYGRTPEPVTPYQKAAQVWDDRIGSARVQAKNWRLMAFGCLRCRRVSPQALSGNRPKARSRPGWCRSIVSARHSEWRRPIQTISRPIRRSPSTWRASSRMCGACRPTRIVLRQNWLRAYDFTTDRGAAALNDYARTNDPFAKLGKLQMSVEVSSVIRASPESLSCGMDSARLRQRISQLNRALDCHPHRRDRDAARCRSAAQESPRRLRPRHQLVEGAWAVRSCYFAIRLLRAVLHAVAPAHPDQKAGVPKAILPPCCCALPLWRVAPHSRRREISYDSDVPPASAVRACRRQAAAASCPAALEAGPWR